MENLFGTDGIRSKVGENILNENDLINLGKSILFWIKQKNNLPKIVIASDTRQSCFWIKSLITSGLTSYKSEIVDAEILPTPAIYNLVEKQKLFDCGIIISASHNPYQDNGIKIVYKNCGKLTKENELEITHIFKQKRFNPIDYDNLGKIECCDKLKTNYLEAIKINFESNFLNNFKIVLDCANGALSNIAPEIFKNFGANVSVINNVPDGKNINKNCGATNTLLLQLAVKEQKADIGFAFDGDGDRIIAVNKEGTIKDGDDIIALLLNNQIYKDINTVVTTIMSNYGLELHLNNKKINLIRSSVGDKFVLQELKKNNLILGGEQSGHIILRDYMDSSDALFTALRVAETIKQTQNWNMETFVKMPQITINLKIASKENLNNEPFSKIIKKYQNELKEGRLIVRYSGTEPLLRLTAESHNIVQVKQVLADLEQELKLAFLEYEVKNENKKTTAQII